MRKIIYCAISIALVAAFLCSCSNLEALKLKIHGEKSLPEGVMATNVPTSAQVTEVVSTPKLKEYEVVMQDAGKENQAVIIKNYNGEDVSIAVPSEFDGVKIDAIGKAAFSDNAALYNVIVSGGIEYIDNFAFYGCKNLTSVSLPQSVKSLGAKVFANCPAMLEIQLPPDIFSMGEGCFSGCTGLITSGLPGALTSIPAKAFDGCTALSYIYIPKSVTRIEAMAFKGCTSLTKIDISANVEYIAPDAFEGCENLKIACPIGSYTADFARKHGFDILDLNADVMNR